MNYIDLFAGCGGLSLGLHRAGWDGLFAIEKSPFAFETLKYNLIENLNHFNWPSWLEQRNYDINEVLNTKQKHLKNLRGTIDLIVGGPPCQGFSSAGPRMENDSRNDLIKSYIKFIREVQPKIIFFENVKGFTQKFIKNKTAGIQYSAYVEKGLRRNGKSFIGYEVLGRLVDFAEFGIPQNRKRFILIGVRKDIFKKGTTSPELFFSYIIKHKESFLKDKDLPQFPTLEEAISDLLASNGTTDCPDSKGFLSGYYAEPKTNFQKYLRRDFLEQSKIPNSHRLAWHSENTITLFQTLLNNVSAGKKIIGDDRIEFNIKKRSVYILDKNAPAPTLTSHPDDYIHYCEPRILTAREYARIQTFPDWFEFKRKYTTGGQLRKSEVPRYTQIGNAIPPLFGELAGLSLKQILCKHE